MPVFYFPCTNQYACAAQSSIPACRSDRSLMAKHVVQRLEYGSAFDVTRADSRGTGKPSVSTKQSPGSSAVAITHRVTLFRVS